MEVECGRMNALGYTVPGVPKNTAGGQSEGEILVSIRTLGGWEWTLYNGRVLTVDSHDRRGRVGDVYSSTLPMTLRAWGVVRFTFSIAVFV